MEYLVIFLEGIITFISPCLLPMLPIYLTYFAGGEIRDTKKTLIGTLGFVFGFMIVFMTMGALAGSIGKVLLEHQRIVKIVAGVIIIFFGINYLGLLPFQLFKARGGKAVKASGFFSSLILGVIFSLGWTPCVGPFLGSALAMASTKGTVLHGVIMLGVYSLGLGIPFILSAILIDQLKGTFNFIKKHYGIINKVAGVLLILLGVLMCSNLYI